MRLFSHAGAGPKRGWPAVLVEAPKADGRIRLAIRVGLARYRILDPEGTPEGAYTVTDYPANVPAVLEAAGYELAYEKGGE
jgi:hypothetical protein